MIFQTTDSSSVSQVAGAYPGSSGRKVETNPGQDALLLQGTLTPTCTLNSLRLEQCRPANSPHVHILTDYVNDICIIIM